MKSRARVYHQPSRRCCRSSPSLPCATSTRCSNDAIFLQNSVAKSKTSEHCCARRRLQERTPGIARTVQAATEMRRSCSSKVSHARVRFARNLSLSARILGPHKLKSTAKVCSISSPTRTKRRRSLRCSHEKWRPARGVLHCAPLLLTIRPSPSARGAKIMTR